jgi:hypothetical protein
MRAMQSRQLFLVAALCSLWVLTACDESAVAPDLSAPPADLATTIFDGGIGCGNAQCPLTSNAVSVCCIQPPTEFCAPPMACSAGIPAYCDGPEDCFGATCCQFGPSAVISCTTQCTGAILCHVDDDCPAATPHCCGSVVDAGGFRACAVTCH